MTKTQRGIGVGVSVVAIAVAIIVWQRSGDGTSTDTTGTAAKRDTQIAIAPAKGDAPTWVGQRGVGGRRIAGVVIGEDGAPVAGAQVRLASVATRAGLSDEDAITTDATGRFDFGGRSGATYYVSAEAPKLTGAVEEIDMRDPQLAPPPDQMRLVLHACATSIHGTIRDNAGGVVAGARVSRDRARSGGVVADAAGAYELCIPAGGELVMVRADGYATLADNVNVFGRTRRDFELGPGASVSGRVVRASDKSSVAGAIVEIRSEDRRGQPMIITGASDADGHFVVDGVAPGRHSVAARAERLASAAPVSVIVEIGGASDDVVCELAGTVTVSGKVVLRGTDTPVDGASVFLMGIASGTNRPSAITQGDGTFAIDQILPGEYRPMISQTMRRRRDDAPVPPLAKVKVESTDVTDVRLEVDPSGSISGRILSDGKPVDGARVQIEGSNQSVESAHDGTYSLRWLDDGDALVYAESHRVGAFGRSRAVTLANGEDRTGVDVELSLSGSIAGVVVDQADKPVPGVFLSFSLLHGRDFGSATTADDGTFTARALSGGGDYVYEVRQRDRSPLVYPPVEGKRFPPITVAYGQTHITDLRVKIRVERLAITGRVTDAANKPVADVVVRALPSEEGRYAFGEGIGASSDQSGAFVIRDLSPGTYELHATAARGEAHVENVVAGQTNVAVRLVELGGIDGTIEGFTGAVVMAMRSEARMPPARAVVSGTSFSFRNLEPGDYRLYARKAGESQYARVTVVSGQIAKVTIRAPEFGAIEGIVVDEKTREPLRGLPCVSGSEDGFGGASKPVTSDARGAFRIERAPVGPNLVACGGAMTKVTVAVGQTARVQLSGTAIDATGADLDQRLMGRESDAGLELEDQLGDVIVKSVRADGPAARAGVLRGDIVVKVGSMPLGRFGSYRANAMISNHPLGTLELVLERNDKQLTVTIKLEPAQAPTP